MQSTGHDMPPLNELRPIDEFTELLQVNKQTIYIWITRGVNPGGLKLRAWKVGSWRTTEAHVREFIERRTTLTVAGLSKPPATSPAIKKRAEAAKAELRKKGVRVKAK